MLNLRFQRSSISPISFSKIIFSLNPVFKVALLLRNKILLQLLFILLPVCFKLFFGDSNILLDLISFYFSKGISLKPVCLFVSCLLVYYFLFVKTFYNFFVFYHLNNYFLYFQIFPIFEHSEKRLNYFNFFYIFLAQLKNFFSEI